MQLSNTMRSGFMLNSGISLTLLVSSYSSFKVVPSYKLKRNGQINRKYTTKLVRYAYKRLLVNFLFLR